jgi:hypothetical protein
MYQFVLASIPAAVPKSNSSFLHPYITTKRWDWSQPRPGYEGLRQEFSDLKIAIQFAANLEAQGEVA